jgi:hypothetical protein
MTMVTRFQSPVPPFPGWERRRFRLSRPVTDEDIEAILNGQEECYRTIGQDRVISIRLGGAAARRPPRRSLPGLFEST